MAKIYRIDDIDSSIIEMLKKDGKAKLHTIAKKINLPPSTIHFRIQRMESEGIIRNTIKLDYKKLEKGVKAIVMINASQKEIRASKLTQVDIAKGISKIKGVISADVVTGDSDLIAIVRAKDVDELNKIVLENIQKIEGIEKTKTMIVLTEVEAD